MNTETETEAVFSKTLMDILRQLDTLPKNEREELLHQVQCSLADVNRMYGQVIFDDEDDLAGAIAAIRAAGFEATIEYVTDEDVDGFPPIVIDEDDLDGFPPTVIVFSPTTTVAVTGVSKLRQGEFFHWLYALVEPFGGTLMKAGYADPAPDHTKPRPTDH